MTTKSHHETKKTNGAIATSLKNLSMKDVKSSLVEAKETLEDVGHQASSKLSRAANATEKLVKKHPFAAVGTVLGAGLLVGAVAQRALHHEPTVGELLMDAVSGKASKAKKAIASAARTGMKSARRAIR